MSIEIMPPLMFGGLMLFMVLGFPVAFSLMAVGLFFGLIAIEQGFFGTAFLQAIPQRVFGSVIANELLLAIPFFTFMGAILEKCGLAEDMLDSMGQLFGRVKGGLGYSVIFVGFILGAITGTVAAQVIAMAMIALPVMMRYRYNMRYATGVLAASGTITQIVPPSLVLIIMADQLKTPTASADVGSMYLGAWIPALMQTSLFMLYTFLLTRIKPDWLPGIPAEEIKLKGKALWLKAMKGILPTGILIFLVLGTIMLGIATPTESGAMGAVGAVVLAVLRNPEFRGKDKMVARTGLTAAGVTLILAILFTKTGVMGYAIKLGMTVLYIALVYILFRAVQITTLRNLITQAYHTTMRITSMVVFILIGSTVFSVVFQGVDGGRWVEHLFSSLPGGWIGFLVIVNLSVFFLAFFLDFFEIAFILVPLLAPVAQKILTPVLLPEFGGNENAAALGALVWFGITLGVNIQTSFMHPPFGFALFYLRGVAPKEVKSNDIYWGAIPWVVIQLIMVFVVMFNPKMTTAFLDKGHDMIKQGGEFDFSVEANAAKPNSNNNTMNFSLDGQNTKPSEAPKSAAPDNSMNFSLDGQTAKPEEKPTEAPKEAPANEFNFQLDKPAGQ
ncbi:TRAP transporter large permease [Thiolinea disciformis]|uniref:TRAP transporter large permease n=1 Tax=Thiolinea disciformis TaxID=125614 RepID=UPI00035E40E0|nr:TRAP transporter large permease subunit [Thiolinea disciformis]